MSIFKHESKCVIVLILISFICLSNARQIRYSRYNTEVIEDGQDSVNNNYSVESENEIKAIVREIKIEPYPVSDNRSMRAYPLPSRNLTLAEKNDLDDAVTEKTLSVETTEIYSFISSTQEYKSETTTVSNNVEESNLNKKYKQPNTLYPIAGFKPRIPFLLPTDHLQHIIGETPNETDIKPPYPAAGYRPSKAFLLPYEQLQLENEKKEKVESKMDNSNHPPCGSSTNPLAPKPYEGEKEDPNSESIFINSQVQQNRSVIIPMRYSVQ